MDGFETEVEQGDLCQEVTLRVDLIPFQKLLDFLEN